MKAARSCLSLGLGFQTRSFAVDVSYRQKVANGNESLIVAGIRLIGE